MPGLLRGVVRTAAVVGTASAVNGRVQRRQQQKFAQQDAQDAYEQAPPPQQQMYEAPAPPPAPAAEPAPDKFEQLKTLGDLKAQGILTEEEFAAEKAKILAG